MASEPIECQVVVLRVSIHCQGCKKKVKKVLQNINGVYRCEIDARSNKVVATISTKLDPYMLVSKLRKSGKQAELLPEQPPPPPPAAAAETESQTQEPKNNQPDEPSKPNEPAEKGSADTAEAAAAEPSNPPEPKQSTGEAPNPAQDSKENASADDAGDDTEAAPAPAPAQQGPSEAKGKAKVMQQPEMQDRQPVDARVTLEYDRGVGGGHVHRMPPPAVMSYNQVRPSVSAFYYAPALALAPAPALMRMSMPMARPGPSQGYIDEHYTPSYYNSNYNRSPAYEPEPYYYSRPQPAPYSYQYQYQPSSSSEDYYYSAPPQRSAFSPPRDAYGEMFNDENANSCTVM